MLLLYDKNKRFLLLYDNNWALCQEQHMVSMIKKVRKSEVQQYYYSLNRLLQFDNVDIYPQIFAK